MIDLENTRHGSATNATRLGLASANQVRPLVLFALTAIGPYLCSQLTAPFRAPLAGPSP